MKDKNEYSLQIEFKDVLIKPTNSYYIIFIKEDGRYNIYDCYGSEYILAVEDELSPRQMTREKIEKIVNEYHDNKYPYDEKLYKRATKKYNIGDKIYYVRGYNPIVGEVFDRVAVFKKEIAKVTDYGLYTSTDNEGLMWRGMFESLEEAKEYCIELNVKHYHKKANEDIYVIDNLHKVKKEIKLKNKIEYSQLSLF